MKLVTRHRATYKALAFSCLVLAGALLAGCGQSAVTVEAPIVVEPTATIVVSTEIPQSRSIGFVSRVIDGDTIEVVLDGQTHTVRYIGIDAPESVDPTRAAEPFGVEAASRNRDLVFGQQVILEKDVSESDQFGRLLRYVRLADGTMVNEILVTEGLAEAKNYPPDVKYADQLSALEASSRKQERGMWRLQEVTEMRWLDDQGETISETNNGVEVELVAMVGGDVSEPLTIRLFEDGFFDVHISTLAATLTNGEVRAKWKAVGFSRSGVRKYHFELFGRESPVLEVYAR